MVWVRVEEVRENRDLWEGKVRKDSEDRDCLLHIGCSHRKDRKPLNVVGLCTHTQEGGRKDYGKDPIFLES